MAKILPVIVRCLTGQKIPYDAIQLESNIAKQILAYIRKYDSNRV